MDPNGVILPTNSLSYAGGESFDDNFGVGDPFLGGDDDPFAQDNEVEDERRHRSRSQSPRTTQPEP